MSHRKSQSIAIIGALGVASLAVAGGESRSDKVAQDLALKLLQQGNARFVDNAPQKPNCGPERLEETARYGQHPFATIIACSDSRVPVEMLFDQGIGDIFTIRVAGNVADTDEVGSIEYGVVHLETPLLIVMGHSHCGAVTAVAQHAELHGSIPALVDNIEPAVDRATMANPDLKGDALVEVAVTENVWNSIEDIIESSPETRERIQNGTLRVLGAVYDIETGKVNWLGEHPSQMTVLTAASGKAKPRVRQATVPVPSPGH
ncbi:MAG: carbonic anhydrase [Phycisphaeraceae bacterium]|nr:carbonic anhydrase [Phycisphaeraceae bacterium]